MTYSITLIKGESGKRERTFNLLARLAKEKDPFGCKVRIRDCFISFGWPDFILLLEGNNIELLKYAIVHLRERVLDETGDTLETSSIVCTTKSEVDAARKKIRSTLKNRKNETKKG